MNRITEPSTWAGIAMLAQMAKAFIPPHWHLVADGLSTVASGAAVAMGEKGKAAK